MPDAERSSTPQPRLAAARVIILTPMMGGADGISEMTRQWTRVLESRVGRDVGRLEIWSLDDGGPPSGLAASTVFRGAGGGRMQFAALSMRDGFASAVDTLVIVMHLQLLPVALPLVWRGARLVTLLMGIEAWAPLRPLEQTALQRSWKIVAISEHTIARFKAANPSFATTPVVVCQPGLPERSAPAPKRREEPYALIVGRMSARERYKGHDTLIDVWPMVRRAVPDARLIVAGDGDDAERLRQKADDGIEFVGRVDDATLAALYRDASMFVMPSTDEGFGLVYLEAMHAATPCIAARGAAEEIITDGVDGLIVDAADRDSLVAAIVRLFVDASGRATMAAAAVRRVAGEFAPAALDARVRRVLELGEP